MQDNLPLPRPGVYILLNLKLDILYRYVGYSKNLEKRVWEHNIYKGCAGKKLWKAVEEFGLESFLMIPLFYQISLVEDVPLLTDVETFFIHEFNSTIFGYNTIRDSRAGYSYGPEHSKACSEAIISNPERYQKRCEINKEIANRPKNKAAFGKRVSDSWLDPEFAAKRKHDMSIANTGYIHYTNGTENISLRPAQEIPPGFFKGTTFKVKPIGSDGKHLVGSLWAFCGNELARLKPGEPLPAGWQYGRPRAHYLPGLILMNGEQNPIKKQFPIRPVTGRHG